MPSESRNLRPPLPNPREPQSLSALSAYSCASTAHIAMPGISRVHHLMSNIAVIHSSHGSSALNDARRSMQLKLAEECIQQSLFATGLSQASFRLN